MKRTHFIYILLSIVTFLTTLPSFAQDRIQEAINSDFLIKAVSEYDAGAYDSAAKILSELLVRDPDNDAACYYNGLVLQKKGDVEKAEIYLKKAVELDPTNYWYRYSLAQLYAATSRGELTVDIYEKLLKDFPSKSELYFDLAQMYSAQGEFDKSLKTLDEIDTIFGKTESSAIYRFNLLRHTGKDDEAFRSLEQYNQEYSSPVVLTTLAEWKVSMYDDSTAVAYYDEAVDLAPDFLPALIGRAEVFRMSKRYDRFFPALKQIASNVNLPVEEKCDYLMALVRNSTPQFLKSFTPQMDTVINNIVKVHSSDSTVLNTAAVYFYSTGRNENAGEYFKKVVDMYPSSEMASIYYLEFLMYEQNWAELSKQGRIAFQRHPDNVNMLEMASVGDFNSKEYEKVLEICNDVLRLFPNDSSATLKAWSTAGDIHHMLGDSKKAYRAYDKALKINPDYIYVLNNYAYYLSIEGKSLKKAYDMSRKTIIAEPDNATYLDTFAWILFLQNKPLEAKPVFKQAMLYGGKESPVILDHYAEVLYALKEYDLAFFYWNLALQKNDDEIEGLQEKIQKRKDALK